MSRHRSVSKPEVSKAELEVFTKEQFNYKRNNSVLMSTCLSWVDAGEEEDYVEEYHGRGNRSVQFDDRKGSGRGQQELDKTQPKGKIQQQNIQGSARAKSAPKKQPSKSQPKKDFSKYEKSEQQLAQEKRKQQQRRGKIKSYIDSMVPYSRTLTDSKFQQFYQKSAPLAYGAANTKQPIGGVVYGANLRSFNVNPHDYQNNPATYQSHTTSLNFAFRTKRNEQKNWKRLEKELNKKLNLHEKNHTLQEGKQVVYVDVDDQNMFQVMRQNLEFKKEHRDDIRKEQQNYEKQKQMKFLAQKEKFYRQKAERLQQNLEKTLQDKDNYKVDRAESGRVRQQVVYRHTDKDGNVRIGADRHALTCFVDINFPENDQLYTDELKKRHPIYQTPVEDRHKNLAAKREENYQTSQSNVYPSHYLLPCSEQPEIQKMLVQKSRQTQLKTKKR